MPNIVKYGLSNVHYAVITGYSKESGYTYDEEKPIPGAVNLTLDPEGSSEPFYADNIIYFNSETNSGYSGDLEIARIPDSFRTEVLGDVKDENGLIIENSDSVGKEFALLFQFEGDVTQRRHVMWRCTASRPTIAGQTKEDTTTPQTDTLGITVMQRQNDRAVKTFVDNTPEKKEIYDNWFKNVYQPKLTADTSSPSNSDVETASTFNAKKNTSML